ncbi:hypothetical protein M758_8G180000 [Ceratodon purpureus]|nr:hypothetical protein M758_8G180000 [Ceratodon purpureus]
MSKSPSCNCVLPTKRKSFNNTTHYSRLLQTPACNSTPLQKIDTRIPNKPRAPMHHWHSDTFVFTKHCPSMHHDSKPLNKQQTSNTIRSLRQTKLLQHRSETAMSQTTHIHITTPLHIRPQNLMPSAQQTIHDLEIGEPKFKSPTIKAPTTFTQRSLGKWPSAKTNHHLPAVNKITTPPTA